MDAQHVMVPRAMPRRFVRRSVPVSPDMSLAAIVIPADVPQQSIYECVTGNDLYYIESWNHFAISIAGSVFHGNIGNIYQNNMYKPSMVKDCRYNHGDSAKTGSDTYCTYYHNPEVHPWSKDVRNFMTDSWIYIHPSVRHATTKYGSRNFGSAEFLDEDIKDISRSDAKRQIEQMFHDFLCALVLKKYVLA